MSQEQLLFWIPQHIGTLVQTDKIDKASADGLLLMFDTLVRKFKKNSKDKELELLKETCDIYDEFLEYQRESIEEHQSGINQRKKLSNKIEHEERVNFAARSKGGSTAAITKKDNQQQNDKLLLPIYDQAYESIEYDGDTPSQRLLVEHALKITEKAENSSRYRSLIPKINKKSACRYLKSKINNNIK